MLTCCFLVLAAAAAAAFAASAGLLLPLAWVDVAVGWWLLVRAAVWSSLDPELPWLLASIPESRSPSALTALPLRTPTGLRGKKTHFRPCQLSGNTYIVVA